MHGFGASAYHWRYNIVELAKKHRVFAIDLLGFGWSDKALVDYSQTIWSDQIAAFIREVVNDGPVVLAGNSLGGYNSLATAARFPELVKCVPTMSAQRMLLVLFMRFKSKCCVSQDLLLHAVHLMYLTHIADTKGYNHALYNLMTIIFMLHGLQQDKG